MTPQDWRKFSSKYTAEMNSDKSLKAIRDLAAAQQKRGNNQTRMLRIRRQSLLP